MNKQDYATKLETLRKQYGNRKELPKEYELQCLIALSHYPELEAFDIQFIHKRAKYTMAAHPASKAIFQRKRNRTYQVIINDSWKSQVPLKRLSFDAQVGVIGHELAHILHYTNKSMPGIMMNGIGYMFGRYRSRFEKDTDKRAIDHGLGWQVYNFSDQAVNKLRTSREYKNYKRKIYMTPEAIMEYIQNQ